ncbi:hypothetical protein PR003_g34680, partial [Phytophthora rubi]
MAIAALTSLASAGRGLYRNSRRGGGFTANVTVE